MSYPYAESAPPGRQRGVALITVLLVFVIATLIATQMLRTSYMALKRTGNLIASSQARYYALGAEDLGRQILANDLKSSPAGQGTDHLRETWASSQLSFDDPENDATIEVRIEDLSGRFNINSLVDRAGKIQPAQLARLQRLLRLLEIDPAIAEIAADWVDKDGSTSRGGSESSAHGLRFLPDRPMVDPSELRSLPGMDAESWKRLAPLVSALPSGVLLNINTAPAEVLLAYVEKSSPPEMERFVLVRDQQPIRDAADPQVATLFGTATTALDVRSSFFSLRVHARYRDRHVRFETRIERDPKKGSTIITGRSDATRI